MFSSGGSKKGIYLDYAATTPVSKRAQEVMEPYFSDVFYNPSSLHIPGQKARGVLDKARQAIGDIIEASWKEIIFTSSATESINLALRGIVKASKQENPHIITTNIEHSAVLSTCRDLEKEGVEVTYLPVDSEGFISAGQVKEALKENTVLVSVGYVNNEIGTIQPVVEIMETIREHRMAQAKGAYALFHTDAVQAANYLDINVKNLGVDLMTISSHKIYGPKGTALLYKKEGVELAPIITGGDQERGYHSGTENLPAIVGFAEALKETQELKEKENSRLKELQDLFIKKILDNTSGVALNGSRENRVPNNISLCFESKDTETLLPALDEAGIYASSGSACKSRIPEPSHVIEAIGKKDCARRTIRFSLGRSTTNKDVERALNGIIKISK